MVKGYTEDYESPKKRFLGEMPSLLRCEGEKEKAGN